MPFWYEGSLQHARFRPREHKFSQGVYYCCLNVDDLAAAENPIFSIEKRNLFSFYTRDHGRRSQVKNKSAHDLRAWANDVLQQLNLNFQPTQIWLTCFPRVLGFAFNPISFWHCYDELGVLRVVICEVNNTFGETHNYVICHPGLKEITSSDWFSSDKVFHVSPFFPVKGRYEFRFKSHPLCASHQQNTDIIYFEDAKDRKPIFTSTLRLQTTAFTWRRCLSAFFRFPLLTFYVVGNIHFQAIKLFFKRAKFHRQPMPPQKMSSGSVPLNQPKETKEMRSISQRSEPKVL